VEAAAIDHYHAQEDLITEADVWAAASSAAEDAVVEATAVAWGDDEEE
jgi:hypothetical protein